METPEQEKSARPALLLHICCGPCAAAAIEVLVDSYEVTGYFYNPNIHPREEYERRRDAARKLAGKLEIPFVEGPREFERFYEAVRGFEHEPENGARCPHCFALRLTVSARYAAGHGFAWLASTLTTGPRKKTAVINPIGEKAADETGIRFVGGDWKKRDGYHRSCELSREYGLYRQHYCGCEFSLGDAT